MLPLVFNCFILHDLIYCIHYIITDFTMNTSLHFYVQETEKVCILFYTNYGLLQKNQQIPVFFACIICRTVHISLKF